MIKLIQKQLDIDLVKASLVFALIYCLMFNISVMLRQYEYYHLSPLKTIFQLSKELLYAYIAAFIFFFGLSIHRILFISGTVFLFITGAIASYYLFYFGVSTREKFMLLIFGAKISKLVSIKAIIWIIFSLFICIFCVKHFNPQTSQLFFSKILMAICLFLSINNIISPQFKFLKIYFPIQYLHNSFSYFVQDIRVVI